MDASFRFSPTGEQLVWWTCARYVADGRIVYVRGSEGGQRIVAVGPRGARQTLATADLVGSELGSSPDGTRIAFEDADSAMDSGFVTIVDVSTGETSHVAQGEHAEWVDDDTLLVLPPY